MPELFLTNFCLLHGVGRQDHSLVARAHADHLMGGEVACSAYGAGTFHEGVLPSLEL